MNTRNKLTVAVSLPGKAIAVLFIIAMIIIGISLSSPVASQAADPTYDPDKAVTWAHDNYKKSKELCAGFVSDALKAGGYKFTKYKTPGKLGAEIVKKGGFVRYTLKAAKDGNVYNKRDNNGIVAKGDVIVWYCSSDKHKNKEKKVCHWLHAALVTKISNDKVLITQTNAPLIDEDYIATVGSCFEDHRSNQTIYCYHYTGKVPVIDPPTFKETPVDGGKMITLKAGAGASIHYRLDGSSLRGYSSPFTVVAAGSHTITYYAEKGGKSSVSKTSTISINTAAKPQIKSTILGDTAEVQINHSNSKAKIYYSTGSNYSLYRGSFDLKKTTTVKAYAVISGMATSDTVSHKVEIVKPSAPKVSMVNGKKISVSKPVILNWNYQSNVNEYIIKVSKNGDVVFDDSTSATSESLYLGESGSYSITVEACNAFGSSRSDPVSVELMEDVTVTVIYDEENDLQEEFIIPYGDSIAKPKVPQKEGHNFAGWDGSFDNITEDRVIKATYEKKEFQVTFCDNDGSVVSRQKVKWHESAEAPDMTENAQQGYIFAGWTVEESSNCNDYTCVDGSMTLTATYKWAQPEFPILVNDLQVKCAPSNSDTGQYYTAAMTLISSPDKNLVGRVILQVQTEYGTAVTIGTKDVTLKAGTTTTDVTMEAAAAGDGSVASVYVVGLTDKRKTAGALSEEVTCDVTREVYYSDWSEWTESLPEDLPEDSIIEEKTQYRYNTKSTATSTTSPSMSGYTMVKMDTIVGSWSAWQDAAVERIIRNNFSREVETRDVEVSYNYAHYCTGNVSGAVYQTANTNKTSNSTFNSKCSYHSIGTFSKDDSRIKTATDGKGGYFYYKSGSSDPYRCSNTCFRWYRMSINYKTQYRYRDTTYKWYFEKISDWSDWSDSWPTSYYQYQSRKVYRYRTVSSTQDLNEIENDESLHVEGVLPASDDLAGAEATALVYKQTNTDPTESQLEYVTQITLEEGNRFDFWINAREALTDKTGDFIVALAIEGGERLINASVIQSPSAEYTVTFIAEGEVVDVQHVESGQYAYVPAAPWIEGKEFLRWDTSAMNITEDTQINAVYKDREYAVVYYDALNGTVDMVHQKYGSVVDREAPEAPEGYQFTGWSQDVIFDDTIVNAEYEKKEYSVVFMDAFGEPIETQTVTYGESAYPPDTEDLSAPPDMQIIGWSGESSWWNVDEDMVITPVAVYGETTGNPILDVDVAPSEEDLSGSTGDAGEYLVTLTTPTEGASIYYTLDGSEPDPKQYEEEQDDSSTDPNTGDAETGKTYCYTGPVQTSSMIRLRAMAVSEGRNNSEIVNLEADLSEYDDEGLESNLPKKVKNTLTAKARSKTLAVKYKKLKKKNQTIVAKKAFTISKAKGTVTYKKTSGSKKITINKKSGKITIKKSLKKGTYTVKIKVTAGGNAYYKAGSKIVKLKIKVK